MSNSDYKTYSLAQPISTHTRVATCQEINCEHYANGWTYDIDMLDERLIKAIDQSGKRYRIEHHEGKTYVVFYPEQQCFREHRVHNDREPFYLLTPHARQMNTRTAQRFDKPENWVDHFATHQEEIKRQRGM